MLADEAEVQRCVAGVRVQPAAPPHPDSEIGHLDRFHVAAVHGRHGCELWEQAAAAKIAPQIVQLAERVTVPIEDDLTMRVACAIALSAGSPMPTVGIVPAWSGAALARLVPRAGLGNGSFPQESGIQRFRPTSEIQSG